MQVSNKINLKLKNFDYMLGSPAEMVVVGEVQQIYRQQPKHPHQHHIAWYQKVTQELCTIEQRPIYSSINLQVKSKTMDKFTASN